MRPAVRFKRRWPPIEPVPAKPAGSARGPLPTTELHLHIEGTLEPELIFELAGRHGTTLPFDIDELRRRYDFVDLQSFLNLYYENMSVLRTRQDFADLTTAYLRRAQQAGVRHAEIFFDPQAHTVRGIPLDVATGGVLDALGRSEADFGVTTGLIVTFLRDRPVAEARSVLDELLSTGTPLLGVGLDSAEVGYPPRLFEEVFDVARGQGLLLVAHAGEEGPPAYIWEALDVLGVSRVDHGIRCLEDTALVDRLVADQIPLTVCPLSNVRLRAVATLAEHPLPRLLERGVLATVNSDDPAYFGGYVDDNFAQLAATFGWRNAELAELARNGVRAAFISDERRTELHDDITAWVSAAGNS